MLKKRERKGRHGSLNWRLIHASRFQKLVVMLAVEGMTLDIAFDFLHEQCTVIAFFLCLGKVLRSSRCLILPAWASDALLRAGHRCQKICCGLLIQAYKPKLLEISLSAGGLAEEYLPALI